MERLNVLALKDGECGGYPTEELFWDISYFYIYFSHLPETQDLLNIFQSMLLYCS